MFLNRYKSMVRPPHRVWNTNLITDLKKDKITLENVQRRGMHLVKSLKHLPYEKRLKILGLLLEGH